MAKGPQVGDAAPDFELEGTEGRFRLSEQRGTRVLLLFYPSDGTPVCTRQFCSYRENAEQLEAWDARVIGISAQDVDTHQRFMKKHGLTVPLLADSGGEVARLYGAWMGPLRMTRRAVVLVDEEGIVRYRHDHRLGLDYQTADELEQALHSVEARA
jgi:thioredoxin-dependent peroxiredoxin